MKITKTAPLVIKKPHVIVRPPTKHAIQMAKAELERDPSSPELVIKIVKSDKGFVAIDNFDVLEAARELKVEYVNVLDTGKGDPLFHHIRSESRRDDINPARLAIAVKEMAKGGSMDDTIKKIGMNRALNSIIQLDLPDEVWTQTARTIDEIYSIGVVSMPSATFFDVLTNLDVEKSGEFLTKVTNMCKAIKPRYFRWPDKHTTKLLMTTNGKKRVTEAITRGATRFECTCGCGKSFGVIGGKIYELTYTNGCFVTGDETGTKIYPIPEKEIHYIKNEGGLKPRFTHHRVTDGGKSATLLSEILGMMEPGEQFLIVRGSRRHKHKKKKK